MSRRNTILLAGIILALAFSACVPAVVVPPLSANGTPSPFPTSSAVDYNLYGSWLDSQSNTTYEFLNSGTYRKSTNGVVFSGSFVFGGPGVVVMRAVDETAGIIGDIRGTYTVSGDTLTLSVGPALTQTAAVYKRLK